MQELSLLPGRVRLRNHEVYNNKSLAKYLNSYLDHLIGVKISKVNCFTATIIVVYDAQKLTVEKIKQDIERVVNSRFTKKIEEREDYTRYNDLIEKRDKSKRNLILFGFLYIGIKVKQALFGKFAYSGSVTALTAASVITIIGGYPVLKRLYRKLSKNIPGDSEMLLSLGALCFTLLRESAKGVMLLMLKEFNNYIKYSADAQNHKLLVQSMQQCKGMAWEKPDILENELTIYKNTRNYQNKITAISLITGMVHIVFNGRSLDALAVLLAFTPTATNTALSTGKKNYVVLLNKFQIFLSNTNVMEKIIDTHTIVFDKTGTLTRRNEEDNSEVLRTDAHEMIQRLKQKGFHNIVLMTGDDIERANEIAKILEIDQVYSNCENEEKDKIILELKKSGTVMMVGDGINNTNAMRSADVSVSFSNFSCDDIKLYSDCILFGDEMTKLVDLICLSQKAYSTINHSIFFAKVFNVFWGGCSFYGHIDAFAAKSINTINSIMVLILNKRIEFLKPERYGNGH